VKRGNTALKRGVGLASAFALAIAGAVVAAPAASAAPTTTNSVRATPIANADQIGSDGTRLAAPTGLDTTYAELATAGAGTGNVPTVLAGVKGQRVSDLQIAVTTVATKTWAKSGDPLTVALSGVTFNGTPSVSITAKSVDAATLNTQVNADEAGTPVALGTTVSATVDSTTGDLEISPSADVTFGATAGDVYVVSVKGIYVDVPADFDGSAAANFPIEATVTSPTSGALAAAGDTAIGYVTPFSVTSTGSYAANAKTTTLPDVTVTELVKKAFKDSATYDLTVTSDPAAPASAPLKLSGTPSVSTTGTSGFEATASAPTAGPITVTASAGVKAPSDANIEAFTVSGVTVENVPAGAKLIVTLTDPAGEFTNAGTFSYTPAQSDLPKTTIGSEVNPPRLAGTNRYDTAAKIAQAGNWSGSAVVLANGIDVKQGVDALSANFLAGAKNAPVLLTDSSSTLPQATQLALTRLFSGKDGSLTIYVLGKTDSVSQAAQDSAMAIVKAAAKSTAKITVTSVAGDNRYETSAAVVAQAASSVRSYDLGQGAYKTAFLASGQTNADALAAGGFSAGAGIPVLLVADAAKALDGSVAKAITDQHIGQVIVLGSTDRVSDDVVTQLKDQLGVANVVRKAGTDRFITAADINTMAFKAAPDGLGLTLTGQTAYLASGLAGWPDALTVGPLAGQQKAPVLTVPVSSLPAAASTFLSTNKANINAIEALGQSDRIADSVITAAQTAIK
jgi:putative cell wall-binding protein